MILNTGSRTDIPAFFGEWMENRVREGFVLVRNPYYPSQVTMYRFDPDTVDLMAFCTKNPAPFLGRLRCLSRFQAYAGLHGARHIPHQQFEPLAFLRNAHIQVAFIL